MARSYQFLKLANLHYFMQGLTFDVSRCAEVLDGALIALNKQTRIPQQIVDWNQTDPAKRRPLEIPGYGSFRMVVEQFNHPAKGMLYLARGEEARNEVPQSFRVFLTMHSPTLDVPMRVELPLRAVLKGCIRLQGTHLVYVHALLADDRTEHVYYGYTGRGWNLRLGEHVKSAFAEDPRLFGQKLSTLVDARVRQMLGEPNSSPALAGMISSICAAGLSLDAALDIEEYLVDKYSLCGRHPRGLNMIPGGKEGWRCLHRLALTTNGAMLETDEREQLLGQYLRSRPAPHRKPGIVERWNDPAYAEAVICGRANRLSADQVREIRYLAAIGLDAHAVAARVGAENSFQVRNVIEGRTYGRIA